MPLSIQLILQQRSQQHPYEYSQQQQPYQYYYPALEYVTKWRAGITQLRAARFFLSFCMVIEHFLDHLSLSVPYDILRFHAMETINDVSVDDVSTFLKLTDRVLKIDNTCRRRSYDRHSTSTCSSDSAPCVPPNNEPDVIDEHEIPPSPVAALSVVQSPGACYH